MWVTESCPPGGVLWAGDILSFDRRTTAIGKPKVIVSAPDG